MRKPAFYTAYELADPSNGRVMATAIVECPRHPRNDTTARPSLVHQRPQTGTDPKSHDPPASPHCLVHLKIARDAPCLLGFAI